VEVQEKVMKEIFIAGRVLLGSYLLFSGFHHFTATAMLARYAHAHGVPSPEAAVIVAGVLLLVAGLSLLLGLAPKVGIAAAALFLIPVTLMMHAFWKEEGAARAAQMVNFTKNFGLLGAVLALAAVPEPWPLSVDARFPHRRRLHVFHH
jgi:putative oxidoreductase